MVSLSNFFVVSTFDLAKIRTAHACVCVYPATEFQLKPELNSVLILQNIMFETHSVGNMVPCCCCCCFFFLYMFCSFSYFPSGETIEKERN